MTIDVNGFYTVNRQIWGATSCDPYTTRPDRRNCPSKTWFYFENDVGLRIYFQQQIIYDYYYDKLLGLRVRASISDTDVNLIGNKPHKCRMIGDGTVHHFGVDYPKKPPAKFYIKCEEISNLQINDKWNNHNDWTIKPINIINNSPYYFIIYNIKY